MTTTDSYMFGFDLPFQCWKTLLLFFFSQSGDWPRFVCPVPHFKIILLFWSCIQRFATCTQQLKGNLYSCQHRPKNTSEASQMPASLNLFSLAVYQQNTTPRIKSCQTILSHYCLFILNHMQKFNNCKQKPLCLNDTFLFCHKGEAALNPPAFVQLSRSISVQSEYWIDKLGHNEGKMPRVQTMGSYCHPLSH